MSFNNLLVAVALTVLWPLGLMGVLAAAEWLERRTLAARDAVPRRPRSTASTPPDTVQAEAVQATVVGDPDMAAASWPPAGGSSPDGRSDAAEGDRLAARRAGGGGRHLRRAGGGRGGGRHERRG
jgi:hypothetical protein